MWLTCKLLGFFVNVIFFYDEKDYFKQKLLLWSQVPFKIISKDYLVLCVEIYAQNKSVLFFDNNLVMLFLKSKLF